MTAINDNRMNISETDAWGTLYADVPIVIQEGEKTVRMMTQELGREIEFKTMQRQIKTWVKEGRLVSVGKRIDQGKLAEAYKMV